MSDTPPPDHDVLLESLRGVGLNRYESSVYLGLLTDQAARIAEIARRTGVPQPKVYQALDALVEKGFCSIGTDSVNKYRPISPRVALEARMSMLRRQENEARLLAEELEALRLAGQGRELWAPPIEVVKGMRQIVDLLVDRIHSAREEILYLGKQPQIPTLEMAKALRGRGDEGVRLRMILEDDYLTPVEDDRESAEEVELFRTMPGEVRRLAHVPTKALIIDRSIALLSISRRGGDSFLVLVLRQTGFVEHILASFERHWDQAQAN